MRVLFQLNHPAHYHLFKNTIMKLKENGHQVFIVARPKDMLEKLLINEDYHLMKLTKGKTFFEKLQKMKSANKEILEKTKKFRPDIVLGTGTFGFLTRKIGVPTLFFGEDDINTNLALFMSGVLFYNEFSVIIAPEICNNSFWNKKTIKYNGYQKLAYLHPNRFISDYSIVEKYFPTSKTYFILRFAELNAYHDTGAMGLNTEIAQHLINLLLPHGDVYITSERELEPQFEKYRLNINPSDIHHVMAYAKLYIGDSQSMAVEAAMLGTPSIRFNSFVGKIGVLEELEHVYGLTYGINSSQPKKLFEIINELLLAENLKEQFQKRRNKMLSEKIDVTAFFTWFIENYPESKKIMRENPDYQYNFK